MCRYFKLDEIKFPVTKFLWVSITVLMFCCPRRDVENLRTEDILQSKEKWWIIIIIIIIFLHGLGRLTYYGIDVLPSFPGTSTISSFSRFVVEGVFQECGVDKLALQERGFCGWVGNPPKEKKVLISKDAQPWISADQMKCWIINLFIYIWFIRCCCNTKGWFTQ